MRYPFESAGGGTSWVAHKNEGKALYERGNYEGALNSYQAALNPTLEAPRQERQILLSNMVACRLKLGGTAQATSAVSNAKQCVELNPNWAKGHVRLASAYIALGGHSNDACNELQTALRLDPGNSLARQMLVRELRRDHAAASAAAPNDVDDGEFPNTHTNDPPQNPNYTPPDGDDPNSMPYEDPIDDSFSLVDRVKFSFARIADWYDTRSSDAKLIIKAVFFILLLYVAFGGRFGLETMFASNTPHRGNYDQGNIYDQYRRRSMDSTGTGSSNGRYDTHNSNTAGRGYHSQGRYDNSYAGGYNDYSYGNGGYSGGRHGGGYSMGMSDGALPSLAILLGVAYICHANGINPLHAMLMMNMMGGRRRRRFGYGYGGGMGMGGGGFGYGGARMRYGGRRGRW